MQNGMDETNTAVVEPQGIGAGARSLDLQNCVVDMCYYCYLAALLVCQFKIASVARMCQFAVVVSIGVEEVTGGHV